MPVSGKLLSGRDLITRDKKTKAFRAGAQAYDAGTVYAKVPRRFQSHTELRRQWQWGWRSRRGALTGR